MKVFIPENIPVPVRGDEETIEVYGWRDNYMDLFVSGYSKSSTKINGMECVQNLGVLRRKAKNFQGIELTLPSTTQSDPIDLILQLDGVENVDDYLVLFYSVRREFSWSNDKSKPFTDVPLKYIKWSSILFYNPTGDFINLTRGQQLIGSLSQYLSQYTLMKLLLNLIYRPQLMELSRYSNVIAQFYQSLQRFTNFYHFLIHPQSPVLIDDRCEYRNQVLLEVIDVGLGTLFGSLLIVRSPLINRRVNQLIGDFTIKVLEEYLVWFMGWPAGLKLNNNLSKFLGEMLLYVMGLWTVYGASYLLLSSDYIVAFGLTGNFGLSFMISILKDYISIVTSHIALFHRVASRIHRWHLQVMASLFRLFRGSKWNVLRQRLDSSDYSLDQLLLGTVLFSIFVFTYPTIGIYYLLFFFSLFAVRILKLALELILVFLRDFPVYLILLRINSNPLLTQGLKLSPMTTDHNKLSFRIEFELLSIWTIFGRFKRKIFECLTSSGLPPSTNNFLVE